MLIKISTDHWPAKTKGSFFSTLRSPVFFKAKLPSPALSNHPPSSSSQNPGGFPILFHLPHTPTHLANKQIPSKLTFLFDTPYTLQCRGFAVVQTSSSPGSIWLFKYLWRCHYVPGFWAGITGAHLLSWERNMKSVYQSMFNNLCNKYCPKKCRLRQEQA